MQNTFKLSSFVMVSMNGQYIRVYLYSESQMCIYDYIHFEEPQKTKANTGGKNDRRTDWGNLHINIPPPYIPYVYTSSSDCYLPTTTNVPVVRWKKNQGDRQKNIKKPAVSLNVIQVTFETWNRLAAHVGAANSQNKNRKHNVSLVVMPAEKKKEEKSISDQNNYPIQANEKLFWHKSIFCLYLFDRCKIMFF